MKDIFKTEHTLKTEQSNAELYNLDKKKRHRVGENDRRRTSETIWDMFPSRITVCASSFALESRTLMTEVKRSESLL